mmetsp:Transcript_27028/g.55707  ORF Transcript_27028/g.55707 Transcript_27028/m.55707 type:complete len:80 (-) Transcript_27028:683-922(-)
MSSFAVMLHAVTCTYMHLSAQKSSRQVSFGDTTQATENGLDMATGLPSGEVSQNQDAPAIRDRRAEPASAIQNWWGVAV